MADLISRTIAYVRSVLQGLQAKQFLSVVLVGFLVLSTGLGSGDSTKAINKRVDNAIHQSNSDRPKTTGEWQQEARETEGSPGERVQRIAKESAEAVKDWGSVYPDTAERSANEVGDNAVQSRNPFSNRR